MPRLSFALATALLFAASTSAHADVAPPPPSDVVVLKNGTRLTGKVLDQDPKAGVTIKLANGKVRVIPPAQVKQVERTEPPDPAASKTPPKPVEAPPADPVTSVPAKDAPDDPQLEWTHKDVHFGVGLEGALVLSRENTAGSLKVLSPEVGVHGSLDVAITGPLYFKLDPLFATFARTSTVPVIRSIDLTTTPGTIVKDSINNHVRVYDLTLRAQLGFDWVDFLTTRVGLRLGLDVASGGATDCTGNSRTSLGGGLASTPLAARFGRKKEIEVGIFFDYLSLSMPRCSIGDVTGFVAMTGQKYQFSPFVTNETVAVGELGLTATYMFW